MSWFTNIFKAPPKPPEANIHCVPAAISAGWAWAVGRKEKVRMAVTHVSKGQDHVQAQGFVNGKWEFLIIVNTPDGLVARIGKAHFDIKPYQYVLLDEWVKDQLRFTHT